MNAEDLEFYERMKRRPMNTWTQEEINRLGRILDDAEDRGEYPSHWKPYPTNWEVIPKPE